MIARSGPGPSGKPASASLCSGLSDARPYVRANAIGALSLTGGACEAASPRDLLLRDPSEAVRLAAADAVARAVTKPGSKPADADARALVRCTAEDRNATVAERCAHPSSVATSGSTEEVAIYVVSDGHNVPEGRAPFALVLADGVVRLGVADRRGEIFETGAPSGTIRLGVPSPLVR
jgi:hypothetical protein